MGRLAFVMALLLAGCAEAPPQHRFPEREAFSYRIVATPYATAICIARNARAMPLTTAEERTIGESSTEVIVRDRLGGVRAVARIDRSGSTTSDVRVRVSDRVQEDHGAFVRSLMTSCG